MEILISFYPSSVYFIPSKSKDTVSLPVKNIILQLTKPANTRREKKSIENDVHLSKESSSTSECPSIQKSHITNILPLYTPQ